ncbi:Integrase core domain protein [Streptomyces sp. ADI95-17]|nr:Integrase core domain protein [Streptomyces sp. ADI95-17]
MSRSVLPHRRLLALDERLERAAARPVIVPEMIVCDHGKAFISRNFRSACRFLEIEFRPTHKGSPFEKGHIEKMLSSVATPLSGMRRRHAQARSCVERAHTAAGRRPTANERRHSRGKPDFADNLDERQWTRSYVAEEPRIRRPHLPGEVRSDSDDLAHRHRPPTCRR